MESVNVFAPVNIAWIKYMGKENGLPTNSSLSMTLKEAGTTTRIEVKPAATASSELNIVWNPQGYVPPEKGKLKVKNFLANERIWREVIEKLGYTYTFPQGDVHISTTNNVPAGTGIATSASAFAALTLAWATVLVGKDHEKWMNEYTEKTALRHALAEIARKGSGSACRSFDGPWVEWHPRTGIHKVDAGKLHFVDLILLIDHEAKLVTSSEAHERVKTSPKFMGRVGRVETRLAQVKAELKKDDLVSLQKNVLAEALDMHELFETSDPSFSYLKPLSREWIQMISSHDSRLPSQHAIITLDAGANVHLFIPEKEENVWREFLKNTYPNLMYVVAREGEGARYV